jgi:hypothetical protein
MRSIVLAACSLGLLAACATGVTETGGEDDGFGGSGFGGDMGTGGVVDPPTTSSTTTTSSTGGFGGMGGGMGVGGGTGGQGAGLVCDFTHLNTCETASAMSPVDGDDSSPASVVTGDTSDWFEIHVVESSGSIFEADLSFTATLDIPAGMDYDLIVHMGSDGGGPNCNATPIVGTSNGNGQKTVSQGWDDSQPIGGEDDSRWLSIEVLHVSGQDCGPGYQWTLTVEGNT